VHFCSRVLFFTWNCSVSRREALLPTQFVRILTHLTRSLCSKTSEAERRSAWEPGCPVTTLMQTCLCESLSVNNTGRVSTSKSTCPTLPLAKDNSKAKQCQTRRVRAAEAAEHVAQGSGSPLVFVTADWSAIDDYYRGSEVLCDGCYFCTRKTISLFRHCWARVLKRKKACLILYSFAPSTTLTLRSDALTLCTKHCFYGKNRPIAWPESE